MTKNALKDFIKAELSGWKKQEAAGLFVVFLIIIVNAFVVKDDIISVISAFCGILYTTIAGKGSCEVVSFEYPAFITKFSDHLFVTVSMNSTNSNP